MQVKGLDHINIVTDRLDETARFYSALLGLERRDTPSSAAAQKGAWMFDSVGNAIVHLRQAADRQAAGRENRPGGSTGALHHVAFRCEGYDGFIASLDKMGAKYRTNLIESIGLRQIFTADPNEVLLELNFAE